MHVNGMRNIEEGRKRMLEKYAESQRILEKYSVLPAKGSDYMSTLYQITEQNTSDVHSPKQPLVLKRINDSVTEIYLPFKDNLALRENYINHYGGIRLGKVLQDLDSLAGAVAYKHASNDSGELAPIIFATAAVEHIDLKANLSPSRNYQLTGIATYVGFSSLEVFIQLRAVPESGELTNPEPNLVASFTMVGRDKHTGKASQLNPLLLEDKDQRHLVKISEQIKEHKKAAAEKTLLKHPPSAEDRLVIHQLWLEASKYQNDTCRLHADLPSDMV